jgi:hypothetical protein
LKHQASSKNTKCLHEPLFKGAHFFRRWFCG